MRTCDVTSLLYLHVYVFSLASLPDHATDDNASDNEVFDSRDPYPPALRCLDVESKLRRATVSGASPAAARSPLSAMDLATSKASSNARPKSFFQRSNRGAIIEWQPLTPEPPRADVETHSKKQSMKLSDEGGIVSAGCSDRLVLWCILANLVLNFVSSAVDICQGAFLTSVVF